MDTEGVPSFPRRDRRKGTSIKYSKVLYTIILALVPQICGAQQTASSNLLAGTLNSTNSLLPGIPVATSVAPSAPADRLAEVFPNVSHSDPASGPYPFERWLDMHASSFAMRYRNVADTNGVHEYDQGSQRTIADGRFKVDPQGKYSIAFHISSGHYFDWAYADFIGGGLDDAYNKIEAGLQPGDLQNLQGGFANYPGQNVGARSGGWSLYFRRLYLDAAPIKQIEFEYGGLDIDRGASSEITSYDDDGYIVGERLLLHDPRHLFFNEICFTYAYLGDIYQPNFFTRVDRLAQGNYRQALLRKTLFKRVDGSVDYTITRQTETTREGAFVKIPEVKLLDAFRIEAYQRLSNATINNFQFTRANGWAITGFKKFHKLDLQGGYAALDWIYDVYTDNKVAAILGYSLNGDGYNTGRHYFARPTYHLTKDLTASMFLSRMVAYNYNDDGYLWNKKNVQLGLNYDLTSLFHRGESPG